MNDSDRQSMDQVTALLDTVHKRRDARCEEIRDAAEKEARATIARAHAEARKRVHLAIVEERRRSAREIDKVRARIETARRQRLQARGSEALAKGWTRLQDALVARWENSVTRARWIAAVVEQAAGQIEGEPWQIDHPPGWDPGELAAEGDKIAAVSGHWPLFAPVEKITAGLRISANAATVDGTMDGILADRRAIEAGLLGELFRAGGDDGEEPHE